MLSRLTILLRPVVEKNLFVTSNMEVDPMITLHMDIVFPNCPCGIIDFKFQTGYSTLLREKLPDFKFYDIDRLSNEVLKESPPFDMAA